MDPVNVPTKFELRSFTHFGDKWVLKKLGQSLHTPMLPFLQNFNFNGFLFRWTL